MDEHSVNTENEVGQEIESYPIEPRFHPVNRVWRKFYDFFASAKLAMFLLVVILACCLAGTTIYRDKRAWDAIFSTLWFNGLLVLLIVNVAFCFFGRIWGRRVTLISLGMILFHLSFVAVFAGIIYNSLFYFRGTIRLTEGESLPSGDVQSYDSVEHGRYFKLSQLRGETKLNRMYTGYKADGKDKRAAYEISVGEGPSRKQGIIYITKHLEYRGFKYFPDKEGYSALVILYDRQGNEIYGAHLPLQSLRQKDDSILYTNGTKDGPVVIPFPQPPAQPLVGINVSYQPDSQKERGGDVFIQVFKLPGEETKPEEKPIATGRTAVGARFNSGDYSVSAKEINYWTAMSVRYEPGQPIILTSLWIGLFGVTLTTVARVFRKKRTVAITS